eukprot:2314633-Amphidinium_carterae.1
MTSATSPTVTMRLPSDTKEQPKQHLAQQVNSCCILPSNLACAQSTKPIASTKRSQASTRREAKANPAIALVSARQKVYAAGGNGQVSFKSAVAVPTRILTC